MLYGGVRVIGGAFAGRRLRAPAGSSTRPTSDRVREALFSILGPPQSHTRVLDLFAGAGTLGLEALSRGAREAVFVDRSRASIACLRRNVQNLGVAGATSVHCADVLRLLPRLQGEFHWIFADPPYASTLAEPTLAAVAAASLLAAQGVLVIEHDRRRELPSPTGGLARTDRRQYGDTELSFYRRSQV